ncbi:hypothetical protein [Micromonospora inositola]|uniref:Uncharacterized protein n=1 Tax=Micromonospora inositola TaxID=47865 RepID=A0A1C5JF83_9ACTN|nr:hypothetical protein [Micromonospora inositola]SCG68971.1 hypothetical protein GA0070613_4534 [Micromonospora inositola]
MRRRGERLTRIALRLGLLVAGVTGAWSVYDAVTGDTAYAADPPPAVTVTGPVDLLRDVRSHVLPPTDRPDPPGAAMPPTRNRGATPPAASTRPAPPPLAHPHRTAPGAPPHRRPAAAPARRAPTPVPGTGPTDRADPPVDEAAGPPPGRTAPAAPTPEHAGRPPNADVTKRRPDTAVRQWSPRETDGTHRRPAPPLRSDIDQLLLGSVPDPSSAGSSGAPHCDAAVASAAAWTPPVVRRQRCHQARPDGLSSRSPRPGTRPA